MNLITTHINADFDALGSLVAAKKLYPDARLLLPGSQERAVREFLSLAKEHVVVESEKECRLDDVTRLVLVDTRHKHRIGVAAELVDKGIEVHIYDHHPHMKGDIVADKDISQEVGATVTILADIIKKKNMPLTPIEATLMLLGIYEETGSLTYRVTTKLDVDMVSFLLSKGASISIVSSYLNRELSENELSMLTRLIAVTRKIQIKGVSISIAEIDSDSYAGELGMIIHKLMEIENIPVLFVFVDTLRGRVDIIARSKLPNVDVNKILAEFGGGGHPSAASAKVRSADPASVRGELIKALKSKIKVRAYAEDIMSPLETVGINEKVSDVREKLLARKVSGLPVKSGKDIAGVINLSDTNKAIRRGFGHSRVKGYMRPAILSVKGLTPIYAIQKMISEKDVGTILVKKAGRAVGMINRTDILNTIYSSLLVKPEEKAKDVVSNLSKKMSALIPRDRLILLKKIGALTSRLGYRAFIVGGFVRDLLLGVKNLDLDIVVEGPPARKHIACSRAGNAIEVGKALAANLGGTVVIHKRFGTCTVVARDRSKIDLATARKEVYERPAALPKVEFSSLKDDLIRRDFTINAMAVSVSKESFGRLVDFFGGEDDLACGRIRVMHDASFIDDPTRIFRAVRFEQRFGFSIDSHTEELIQNAMEEEMFDKVQPQRIRDEIIPILKEGSAVKALKRMAELHELRFIHPKITLDKKALELYASIDAACLWYDRMRFKKRPIDKWLMYLMALIDKLDYQDAFGMCKRFVFKRGEAIRILSYKKDGARIERALKARGAMPPSEVHRLLKDLSYEVILMIAARSSAVKSKKRIRDFFERYNGVRVALKGQDLESLGLKPGPAFKRILDRVLIEKLNGRFKSKKDEIEYVKKLMRSKI